MENDFNNQSSHKEQYELKQQKRIEAQNLIIQKRKVRRLIGIAFIILVIAGGLGGLVRFIAIRPNILQTDVIAHDGIHWHPHLAIYIKDQVQEIPSGIGLGITEQSLHTHDTAGILHLEISGRVTKSDTMLGRFFKIWGKQFNSNCIFEYCNGPNGRVKMIVNGQENNDFDKYLMKDGDQIEIRYQ